MVVVLKLRLVERCRCLEEINRRQTRNEIAYTRECHGTEKIHKVGLIREAWYFYFVDKQEDILRTPMARKGSISKQKEAKKIIKKDVM